MTLNTEKPKPPRGRRFAKGQPKPVGSGRQRGTRNKVQTEVGMACRLIVDDPNYRMNLLKRARRGDLLPAVEVMLWHYAKGKPREQVEVTLLDRDLGQLTDAELQQRLVERQARLRDLIALLPSAAGGNDPHRTGLKGQ